MDFSKIASSNGFLVLLMPGSTKPLGLTLEVLPPDHPDLKKYLRTQRDKHRTLSQRGRGVQTADEERWSREMAMLGVVGWEWTMDGDGNPGEWKKSTPDFDKTILGEMIELEWLRTQIDVFMAEEKNFFRA